MKTNRDSRTFSLVLEVEFPTEKIPVLLLQIIARAPVLTVPVRVIASAGTIVPVSSREQIRRDFPVLNKVYAAG